MKTFTIENETNNITVHTSAAEASKVSGCERFATEEELSKLAADWPTARLIEIWNRLPGVTPVTKFANRKAAVVSRIWKALQSFGDAVYPEASEPEAEPVTETPNATQAVPATAEVQAAAETAPEPEATPLATEPVTSDVPEAEVRAHIAPQSPDDAAQQAPAGNEANPANDAPAATGTGTPREESKTSQVIAMLTRDDGTTLEEIMAEMGWLKHTTRAMLSAGGSLTKKHGLIIVSEKVGDKRVYSIKA